MSEQGKTDEEISAVLGVSRDTFHRWRKKYPELREATSKGKEIADKAVVNSLYSRAMGMKITEKKVIKNPDGSVRQEISEKQIPPDPASMIFWLKNRMPKEWRDKQEVEHSGEIQQSVIVLPANGRRMKEVPDGTVVREAIE